MKIRINRRQIFIFLLVAIYAIRGYTDAVYVANGSNSIWVSSKYIILALTIMYGVFLLPKNLRLKGYTIFKNVTITVAVFGFISLLRMIYVGVFSADVLMLAMHMLIPVVITVLMVNILNSDEIYDCMSLILIVCCLSYVLFEIGLSEFSIGNIMTISFAHSYSPYESHYTAGTAMALCAYFSFYRKNKFYTILSFVFSFLTFKRMLIICSIVLFVMPMIISKNKKVSRKVVNFFAISFVIGTLLYYWCLIPENIDFLREAFGIESLEKITSYRSVFFEMYYSDPFFENSGWGSCLKNFGHIMEMDLIQIYIELTLLGLIVFCVCYWNLAGNTVYGVIYMLFNFLNMLSSHSIENGYIWSLIIITFLQIELDTYGEKGTNLLQKRMKIKV